MKLDQIRFVITNLAEQQDAARGKAAAPGAQAQPVPAATAQPQPQPQPMKEQQQATAQGQAAPNAAKPLEGYEMEEKKTDNEAKISNKL